MHKDLLFNQIIAAVLAILTKQNTVDYSVIFAYELSVCKLNTLGVWQRKEDQATTANSVIILCLHLSHLLYGIS